MIIVLLKYKVPMPEIDKYLTAHREFLHIYYTKGLFIASGPMNSKQGGVVIVASNNQSEIEALFQQDPFYLAELADYQFIKFTPIMHCEALQALIQKTEGDVC